jgi:hypothetical protein
MGFFKIKIEIINLMHEYEAPIEGTSLVELLFYLLLLSYRPDRRVCAIINPSALLVKFKVFSL